MSQVRITARLCFLCYDLGDTKIATHAYQTTTGDEYDVCNKCKKLVEKAGDLSIWEISDPIKTRGLY